MTGDQSDVFSRLKGMLPSRWFGTPTDPVPLVDAVLTGLSTSLAFIYSLYLYAKQQTRISTATDGWLDMIAADFFGPAGLSRKTGQSDASYRNAIKVTLLREKATRNAIIKTLVSLTGRTPTIIEPQRPADTGAYGAPNSGYGVAGSYGSLSLPYQAFVIAYRPHSSTGIASVAGYGISTGGYGQASQAEYASMSMVTGGVADSDIYAAVAAVKPEGTTIWTTISN
ncbi:hypothetical protein [Dyella halodurans]|uniref:Phage tail protein n=1 Tax=Dyella halodurans TaxID=1920171 RepID=A0ABV9C0H7_9GAMM|nr:hypothetical protein [Dyella halodurans]